MKECTVAGGCVDQDLFVTMDANWRWYHHPDYSNCFGGNGWLCTGDECDDCTLTDQIDYGAYGITTDQDELKLVASRISLLYLIDIL